MAETAKELAQMVKKRAGQMQKEIPDVMNAFGAMFKAAEADGALSQKVKELMSLALGIASECKYCIALHLDGCLKAGATREEIVETIGVAIAMGGGPSYTYSAFTLECLEELQGEG